MQAAFQAVNTVHKTTVDDITFTAELSRNLLKQFNALGLDNPTSTVPAQQSMPSKSMQPSASQANIFPGHSSGYDRHGSHMSMSQPTAQSTSVRGDYWSPARSPLTIAPAYDPSLPSPPVGAYGGSTMSGTTPSIHPPHNTGFGYHKRLVGGYDYSAQPPALHVAPNSSYGRHAGGYHANLSRHAHAHHYGSHNPNSNGGYNNNPRRKQGQYRNGMNNPVRSASPAGSIASYESSTTASTSSLQSLGFQYSSPHVDENIESYRGPSPFDSEGAVGYHADYSNSNSSRMNCSAGIASRYTFDSEHVDHGMSSRLGEVNSPSNTAVTMLTLDNSGMHALPALLPAECKILPSSSSLAMNSKSSSLDNDDLIDAMNLVTFREMISE